MGLQQNRFPMGKNGNNTWGWVIFGVFLIIAGIAIFRRNKETLIPSPAISSKPEKEPEEIDVSLNNSEKKGLPDSNAMSEQSGHSQFIEPPIDNKLSIKTVEITEESVSATGNHSIDKLSGKI